MVMGVETAKEKEEIADINALLELKNIFKELNINIRNYSEIRYSIVQALRQEEKDDVESICGDILYIILKKLQQ